LKHDDVYPHVSTPTVVKFADEQSAAELLKQGLACLDEPMKVTKGTGVDPFVTGGERNMQDVRCELNFPIPSRIIEVLDRLPETMQLMLGEVILCDEMHKGGHSSCGKNRCQ
jgi:hypothetical protein